MARLKKAQWQLVALLVVSLMGVMVPAIAQSEGELKRVRIALSGADAEAFKVASDTRQVASLDMPTLGPRYERYEQTFRGVTVFGADLTIFRNAEGDPTFVFGDRFENLRASNSVRLTPAEARKSASADVGPGRGAEGLLLLPEQGRYVYEIETLDSASRWFHFIDADNGEILNKFNAVDGVCGLQQAPCGFGVEYDQESVLSDVKDLTGLTYQQGSNFFLQSPNKISPKNISFRQMTFDMKNTTNTSVAATDLDNSWIALGNNSPAQQSLVDIQYYGDVTDDFYLETQGFNWVAAGRKPMRLHGHYGTLYNNAFWNGYGTYFGDGDQAQLRELTSLDVVAHELAHGTTQFTSNLIYRDEPGALNEAFSDIMGSAAEFYADEHEREPATNLSPDFLIGEDIELTPDAAPGFRNLSDPEEDQSVIATTNLASPCFGEKGVYIHPDHYSERFIGDCDNGYVHINSGIPNHAFYLLSNGGQNASCAAPLTHRAHHCTDAEDDQDNVGVLTDVSAQGWKVASQIFFQGFTALTRDSDMCDARAATELAAARFPEPALANTTKAWLWVGVTDQACGPGGSNPSSSSHVGDLDGATASNSGGSWRATTTVSVHNGNGLEQPVSGALVRFSISGSYTGASSCTTDATGVCRVSGDVKGKSVRFTVSSIEHGQYTYDPTSNHDPDGDSDGTSITLSRP